MGARQLSSTDTVGIGRLGGAPPSHRGTTRLGAARSRAYPSEWTIADVLSHVGSGAVIMQRRLDDSLAGRDRRRLCPVRLGRVERQVAGSEGQGCARGRPRAPRPHRVTLRRGARSPGILDGTDHGRLRGLRRHAPQRAHAAHVGCRCPLDPDATLDDDARNSWSTPGDDRRYTGKPSGVVTT